MDNSKQISRIEALIERLKAGKYLTKPSLRRALTVEQMDKYIACQVKPSLADLLSEMPDVLKTYVKILKRADFLFARVDAWGYKQSKPHIRGGTGLTQLSNQADSAYEHAFELLKEMHRICPNVMTWLDRSVDFTPGKTPSMSPEGMPRLITSKSCHLQNKNKYRINRRQLKIDALESILEDVKAGDTNSTGDVTSFELPFLIKASQTKKLNQISVDDIDFG